MAFSGSSDYDQKVAALARRRKMAELLQADALKPFAGAGNVGRTSFLEPLGQMAKAFAATRMNKDLDAQDEALSAARSRDMEALTEKLAGTPITVPGTLPRQPDLATPPPQMEGAPPAEGEPDLRTMLTQKLAEQTEQAGPASTTTVPLNRMDTATTLMKMGDTAGGTAGAALFAKGAESMIPPTPKETKYVSVTSYEGGRKRTSMVNERNPLDRYDIGDTADATEAGGAKRQSIQDIKNDVVKYRYPDMDDKQALSIATSLANGLVTEQVNTVTGEAQYVDRTGKTMEIVKGSKKPTVNPANPEPQPLDKPTNLPLATPAPAAATGMIPKPVDAATVNKAWSPSTVDPNAVSSELDKQKQLLAATSDPTARAQIEKNIAVLGAPAAVAKPADPYARRPMPQYDDPKVAAAYVAKDPRNALYVPSPRDPYVSGTPSKKHLERLDEASLKISDERAKARLPEQETALQSFRNLMDKIAADPKSGVIKDPETGQYRGAIPGQSIESLIPKWFLSQNSQDAASAHAALSNIFSQMRSGLAVTDQEEFRKKLELGTNWQFTPETAWNAFSRYEKLTEGVNNAIVGRYPTAVQDYWHATKPEIVGATPLPSAKPKTAESRAAEQDALREKRLRKAHGY